MFRFLTAGESHGKCLTAIVEGIPSGLALSAKDVDRDLKRRQGGYGRGGRMKIESDHVEFVSGVRGGITLGSPIAMIIQNKDWENWQGIMAVDVENFSSGRELTKPRPGHADLVGGIKYAHKDLRNVLERASARETAARVAVGALAKRLLNEFEIKISSCVIELSHIKAQIKEPIDYDLCDDSPLRCPDPEAEKLMMEEIDAARRSGDTVGGVFQVVALGAPIGLGSYAQWDRRLNARLVYAIMGIHAIKGVEIGLGFEMARRRGSTVHDEIAYDHENRRFYRKTNNAGGIEGGISNGEPIVIKAAMKPLSTLGRPLQSVDFNSKEPFAAQKERTDACALPAAAIVGEAVVAVELASTMTEKFGGDSLSEMKRNYESYLEYVRAL